MAKSTISLDDNFIFKFPKKYQGYFDPNYWEVIKKFSKINELYVLVYDHNSKIRYGYWYDEDDSWVCQNIGDYKPYLEEI